MFGSSHNALSGDRLTPSIFLFRRPSERLVVLPGLDRLIRINTALGDPISEHLDDSGTNPKRNGEPHEH